MSYLDDVRGKDVLYLNSLDSRTNKRALEFFLAVAEAEVCGNEALREKLKNEMQVVIVVPAYESLLPFLQALNKIVTLSGVIVKNSTGFQHPEYKEKFIRSGLNVLDLTKSDFSEQKSLHKTYEVLSDCLDPSKTTVVMDHGGYFAYHKGAILKRLLHSHHLVGSPEYTANGHKRYEKAEISDPVIYSIGYSPLKQPSDESSGLAVVYASLAFAANNNVQLMDKRMKIGVLGLGNLGRSIVNTLARLNVKVAAYDTDELKLPSMLTAYTPDRNKMIRNSDILFCATGNGALTRRDLKYLKDGVVIFTVTSSDDELQDIFQDLEFMEQKGDAYAYKIKGTKKKIWLAYNGEAANTKHTSLLDPTIYLPLALHMVAAIRSFKDHLDGRMIERPADKFVLDLPKEAEKSVARVYHKLFNGGAPQPFVH